MAIEHTFSILKPDATRRNLTGAINTVIEKAGLSIIAQKRVRWTHAQAAKFYEEHKARPFFGELCTFMTSGPIVLQVLSGRRHRQVSRSHGRHRSERSGSRYHSQTVRRLKG